MEDSVIYLAIESMMQMGMLAMQPAELTKALQFFEEQKLITAPERNALLELAEKLAGQSFIH